MQKETLDWTCWIKLYVTAPRLNQGDLPTVLNHWRIREVFHRCHVNLLRMMAPLPPMLYTMLAHDSNLREERDHSLGCNAVYKVQRQYLILVLNASAFE